MKKTTPTPDGSWAAGTAPQLAPDGAWVGAGGSPQLAPNGRFVPGTPTLTPDGNWV